MTKHNEIYPNEAELKQVQNVVGTTEKALKLVSDQIADEDQKEREQKEPAEVKVKEEKPEDGDAGENKDSTEVKKPAEKAGPSKDTFIHLSSLFMGQFTYAKEQVQEMA